MTFFACADSGANSVTLTVFDLNGNSANCTATVTVQDTAVPTAICQDITLFLDGSGNATITAADIDGGSSDNCGTPSLMASNTAFTCADTGINSVTLTVTDVSSNSSSCNAFVIVGDSTAPAVVCQDITIQLDGSGSATITAGDVDSGTADNCGLATLSVAPDSFTCANVGANTVTLTATDVSSNTSSCTANVTVEDTIPPTAVCQDITVFLDGSGNASIVANDIDGGSSDNCGIDTLTAAPTAFTCADTGANPVTLTATDVNGNTNACVATVTVEDSIAPTALCQDITVYLDATGNATITGNDVAGFSSDNCAIDTILATPNMFTCSDIGPGFVSVTVFDVNGNSSPCTSLIEVQDTVRPTMLCQDITIQLDSAGNASITASSIDAGSNDACGAVILSANPTNFTCTEIGPNTVTLSGTDPNANVDSCTATVTVQDPIVPNAACRDITIQLDAAGMASITADSIDNGSFDNCGIDTLIASRTSFTCADTGANSVTLTVIPIDGANDSCVAIVTVEDTIPPTAVCQDITIQLDGSGNASITSPDVDGGSSDNCSLGMLMVTPNTFTCSDTGANTVTLTVPDVNGNSSSCTATVTVEDTIPPAALCMDITIQLDTAGVANITTGEIDAGSNDACGIQSLVLDSTSFDCGEVGANTVTLTVTDNNGNVSTCTATVTVEDTIPPTALCQDITLQLDTAGNASITPGDIDAGSIDNCGVDSLSVAPSCLYLCGYFRKYGYPYRY